jgi:hypothetical protein
MAIVTLPNGAKYNTSLELYQQPITDEYSGSIDFAGLLQLEGNITNTFISGSNPNLPRRNKTIYTDTQYDTYNYILEYTYLYLGTTYKSNGNSIYIKVEAK